MKNVLRLQGFAQTAARQFLHVHGTANAPTQNFAASAAKKQ
jgi:hypothetical protein